MSKQTAKVPPEEKIEYKGALYSLEAIKEGRAWLSELTFADDVDFDELTAQEVLSGISRHWDGGLPDFMTANLFA